MCKKFWNICNAHLAYTCDGLVLLDHKELCDAGKRGFCTEIEERTSFVWCLSCTTALGEWRKTDTDRDNEDVMISRLGQVHLEVEQEKRDADAALLAKFKEIQLEVQQKKVDADTALLAKLEEVHLEVEQKKRDADAALLAKLQDIHLEVKQKKGDLDAALLAKLNEVHLEVEQKKRDADAALLAKLKAIQIDVGEQADMIKPVRTGTISLLELPVRVGRMSLSDASKPPAFFTGVKPREGDHRDSRRSQETSFTYKTYRPSPMLKLALGWPEASLDANRTTRSSKFGTRERSRSPERRGPTHGATTSRAVRSQAHDTRISQLAADSKSEVAKVLKDLYRR